MRLVCDWGVGGWGRGGDWNRGVDGDCAGGLNGLVGLVIKGRGTHPQGMVWPLPGGEARRPVAGCWPGIRIRAGEPVTPCCIDAKWPEPRVSRMARSDPAVDRVI